MLSISTTRRLVCRIARPVQYMVVILGMLNVVQNLSCGQESTNSKDRVTWTSSKFIGTPEPPLPYRVEIAFPELKFERSLDIAFPPNSDRLFIVEQGGKLYSFLENQSQPKLELVHDFKQSHPDMTALYALTFHPQFDKNRYIFVCTIRGRENTDGTVISRFRLTDSNPPTVDVASEKKIITWLSGGHNGCCLKFGPDGYLYISAGDGAGPDPPDPLRAGQDVTNLLSSIMRVDVDNAADGKGYRIPPDNPLIGIPDARPEIWAYGFRNPWRMSFDRTSGDLWVGDVGWQLWEMIYRVQRGGNYGWPIIEGSQPVLPDTKPGPTPILPPTTMHPHSEAASITGGYVYHGERFPELRGKYVYGDFQTGKVWALQWDGKQVASRIELANTPLKLVAFGENRAGELYLLDYEAAPQIYRLARNNMPSRHTEFPRKLSQTGLFTSAESLTAAPGVVPYAINAEPWADYTSAQRWLAVPGTETIKIEDKQNWSFPEGSVVAKTISIELEHGVSNSRRRLETQVLHREQGTWRPYTYLWNSDQTDAELVPSEGTNIALQIRDKRAIDGVRQQNYRVASRAECQLCHNSWVEKKSANYGLQSASLLGISIGQLNRPFASTHLESNVVDNQIAQLLRSGLLTSKVPVDLESAVRFSNPYDSSLDLHQRVKSYLHVNCAHCHQMHAGGTATIQLAFETKLEDAKMVGVRPAQGGFGISDARLIAPSDPLGSVLHYRITTSGGGRMPRLGSQIVDDAAVAMVHDWIAKMPNPAGTNPSTGDREQELLATLVNSSVAARAETVRKVTSSTRGALKLLKHIEPDSFPSVIRQEIVSLAIEHQQAEIRDLFERYVPPEKRIKRLGTVIDAVQLLAMPTNVERGKQLFFRDGTTSCKSCHRVGSAGETIGPELSQIGKKYAPSEMLSHLLEPSKFIEPKYVPYLLETVDGQVHTGLLIDKNEQEIRLRNNANQEIRIKQSDVEIFAPRPTSMMPELLLRDMTPQEAADLVAYLCSLK